MDLARVYSSCATQAAKDLGRNPWVLLLPIGYAIAFQVAGLVAAQLGFIGGFLMGFVAAALLASFLYVVDELVARAPMKPSEIPQSFGRYLWPVVNVLFIFWLKDLLLDPLLARTANGHAIGQAIFWVLVIALNATPEVIYLRRLYSGLEILQSAVSFLVDHAVGWFVPNLAIAAVLYYGLPFLTHVVAGALGLVGVLVVLPVIAGAVVLPVFVFRGHLFRELDTSSARQRRFRYGR